MGCSGGICDRCKHHSDVAIGRVRGHCEASRRHLGRRAHGDTASTDRDPNALSYVGDGLHVRDRNGVRSDSDPNGDTSD